jgi:hypothetical protein
MKKYVEKSGILKIVPKIKNRFGCYRAALYYSGKQIAVKNFFPANWPRQKVVTKIREAYNNYMCSHIKSALRSDGSFIIQGTTQEGLIIEMFINKQGTMVTAYPARV